jgi:hypothetical protein
MLIFAGFSDAKRVSRTRTMHEIPTVDSKRFASEVGNKTLKSIFINNDSIQNIRIITKRHVCIIEHYHSAVHKIIPAIS